MLNRRTRVVLIEQWVDVQFLAGGFVWFFWLVFCDLGCFDFFADVVPAEVDGWPQFSKIGFPAEAWGLVEWYTFLWYRSWCSLGKSLKHVLHVYIASRWKRMWCRLSSVNSTTFLHSGQDTFFWHWWTDFTWRVRLLLLGNGALQRLHRYTFFGFSMGARFCAVAFSFRTRSCSCSSSWKKKRNLIFSQKKWKLCRNKIV